MDVDPKHLMQLAEILDCGSFTAAAARLNTSQPALSRMATGLETRLGAPLFLSRRNPVAATPLGKELAGYGRSIRASSEHVAALTAKVASGRYGELTIGAPPFQIDRVLSRFFAVWLTDHPELRIDLRDGYAPTLVSQLVDGRLDLIILAPFEVIEGHPELIVERVSATDHAIICRAGHPLLEEREITSEMLALARWVSPSRESLLHRETRLALTAAGLEHIGLPTFETTSAGAVRMVVAHSDMLTVLPGLVAADLVDSGDYAIVPFRLPVPAPPLSCVTHRYRQTPALRAFRTALRQEMADNDARAQAVLDAAYAGLE